ncbi:MAG TPA: hypothetical protein VMV10_04900 [Pirellulales bacterium]|nr:hypothetical protein [Pirellulales bacterium]
MKTRFYLLSLSGVLLLAAMGCNRAPARPEAAELPVTGLVTLDGKPLAGAEVTFNCTTSNAIFSGATDENGKYQLWSNFGSNAKLEGHCTVKISKMELPPGVELPPPDMPPVSPMMLGAKESLPPRYSDGVNNTLSADVPAGGGTFDFELTSK